MSDYTLVGRLGDDMPVLEHFAYGVQIWTQIKTRKEHRCAICGRSQEAGARMFRPITNGTNRYERICPTCMHTLMADVYRAGHV